MCSICNNETASSEVLGAGDSFLAVFRTCTDCWAWPAHRSVCQLIYCSSPWWTLSTSGLDWNSHLRALIYGTLVHTKEIIVLYGGGRDRSDDFYFMGHLKDPRRLTSKFSDFKAWLFSQWTQNQLQPQVPALPRIWTWKKLLWILSFHVYEKHLILLLISNNLQVW